MSFSGFSFEQIVEKLESSGSSFSYGEEIKSHTTKKIEFVKSYVDQWLFVLSNVSKYIFFIDAMSNAGLYENNYLSTSIEVLNVFVEHAKVHPDVQYYLLSNDYDEEKVKTMNAIFNIYQTELRKAKIYNISMTMFHMDACDFLNRITKNYHFPYVKGVQRSILLWVDPYNFLSCKLAESIRTFSNSIYCEVLLNFFCNDYSRNITNPNSKEHKKELIEFTTNFCKCNSPTPKASTLRDKYIEVMKETTQMNYHYFVTMKNKLNAPLYYLLFLTPNLIGLEKAKEATWKVLEHNEEYCESIEEDPYFINLFGENPQEAAFSNALYKIDLILADYVGTKITYKKIEEICLQNTFMKKGHVIDKVIKPFIDSGKLIKQNIEGVRNYTKDEYLVKGK